MKQQKMFLTSITTTKILDLVTQSFKLLPGKTKVAFIPTAAKPYENKEFVEEDKENWIKAGYQFVEVYLENKNEEQLYEELKNYDIIYCSGGNTFYLLQEVLST